MSYSRQKVLKALQGKGCRFLREGSRHTIFTSGEGNRVEVPRHLEIPRGTARNIARQARIEWHDFEKAIS